MMQSRCEATLTEIAALSAWAIDPARQALHRRLRFTTFGEALAAIVRIGVEADKMDHHPEWSNVFGTIDIWLTTHDVGGISSRDLALARIIDVMFPSGNIAVA